MSTETTFENVTAIGTEPKNLRTLFFSVTLTQLVLWSSDVCLEIFPPKWFNSNIVIGVENKRWDYKVEFRKTQRRFLAV